MTRKKIFTITATLSLITLIVAAAWRLPGSDDACMMYGTVYTPIKDLKIGNSTYYLYRSESGSHEKVTFISLTPAPIPEVVCDYSNLQTPIYSTDIESGKHIQKLSITHKPDGSFTLEPVYADALPAAEPQNLDQILIEVNGSH
jgi:hypothetical protein